MEKIKITIYSLIFLFCFFATDSVFAAEITTLTLLEKDGITTSNYPLTFGHVFKKGEVTAGVVVEHESIDLLTQFDIKSYWGDGSVKHGVISVIIPTVDANSIETLTIKTGALNSNAGEMSKAQTLATDIESRINLSNISGSGYSGSLDGYLRTEINNSATLTYWLRGPVCTEILIRKQLNNSISINWEVRFYPGTSFAPRVSISVDNVAVEYRGNITYDATIYSGNQSPVLSYSKNGFTQLYSSRWRKVIWQAVAPSLIEQHYDTDYLISTKLIPSYDLTIPQDMSYVDNRYTAYLAGGTDIDGHGYITLPSGQGGGRPDIGILPGWQAQLLKTWDSRMWDITIGHAQLAGHFPHHYQESDSSKSGFGGPVTIDDRPTIWEWKDKNNGTEHGLPTQIGDTTVGSWVSDRNHLTEYNTLPYLLTGDRWFLDQLYYAASHVLNFDSYRRTGIGDNQSFMIGDGSQGLIYSEDRGVAWGLRVMANAVVFGESGSDIVEYIKSKFEYNIDWFTLANTPGTTANGKGIFRSSREFGDFGAGYAATSAPWQHAFVVVSLSDMINKEAPNLNKIILLRDHIGAYTVGVFTNEPSYNKWDGFGLYYGPLSDKNDDYFSNLTWSELHAMAIDWDANTPAYTQNLPWSEADYDASGLADDAHSRAYIYLGALGGLGHLTNGVAAYDFVKSELKAAKLAENPTWSMALVSGNVSTCSDQIQNNDETGVDCGGSCPACDNISPASPTGLNVL